MTNVADSDRWKGDQKAIVRNNGIFGDGDSVPTIYSRKSAIMIPGCTALCVQHLMENNIILPSTHQVWLENDINVFKTLPNKALSMGIKNIDFEYCNFEDYIPNRKFDFMNADLMFCLTPRTLLAFERNYSRWIDTNTSIVFWGSLFTRQYKSFYDWFAFKCTVDDRLKMLISEIQNTLGTVVSDQIILNVALLRCALYEFDMDYVVSYEYNDTTPMFAIRFDNVNECSNLNVPSISHYIHEFFQNNIISEEKNLISRVTTELKRSFDVLWNGEYHYITEGKETVILKG